jgi:alanine or glycine:cation symporter, AGCS family
MTALVIVITGVLQIDPETGTYLWNAELGRVETLGDASGVALTSAAFGSAITWFPYVLAIAVILFAFSTMISWSYYGLKAWTYMFGEGRAQELSFKILFCLFVVIGAAMNLGPVIDFSDAAIFAMGLFNIVGLYVLMPVVKAEMQSYMARLQSGEIRRFH